MRDPVSASVDPMRYLARARHTTRRVSLLSSEKVFPALHSASSFITSECGRSSTRQRTTTTLLLPDAAVKRRERDVGKVPRRMSPFEERRCRHPHVPSEHVDVAHAMCTDVRTCPTQPSVLIQRQAKERDAPLRDAGPRICLAHIALAEASLIISSLLGNIPSSPRK